ncbi:MAG TPA: PTS sugar transporter subunit IIA [Candidatus Anaerostipes excrementavium]|uniref:Mannitol-specific phosphotransferase enzyme IIA component n=1 Tax=Candidatus Anaerostipes excrementavium TaxID=2838463 RepID=A0A9D1WWE6_9FIRM|nr:PTS sugar transporter subunit IIA [uncultured Anaerostipes sp.]HIX68152.1 PTS sugar transporter subunit IIA [Candidatus Anaerostipes excrementavium]
MSNVFDENSILLNQSFEDKIAAIRKAGKMLEDRGCVDPEYIDAMIERDEKVSVYIGNGVAIPHGVAGSEKYIKASGVSFIQVPDGIDFGEGKKAFIVIGIAGVNDEHLDILAKLAITCSDMDKVEQLRTAASKDVVMKILSDV